MAKAKDIKYYAAVGRRKESVAQVRLYLADKAGVTIKGKKIATGQILVNDKILSEIFVRQADQKRCTLPLDITNNTERFAVSIKVAGGGKSGQIDAIAHGISRALVLVEGDDSKTVLRQHGFITRDPRAKERRKVGTGGKARRQKQSPKR